MQDLHISNLLKHGKIQFTKSRFQNKRGSGETEIQMT